MQFPQRLYEFTFPPKVCQIPSSSHLQLYLSFCFTTIIDIIIVYYCYCYYYHYYHFTITQSHSNWREVVFYYRFDLWLSDAKWSWVVFYKLIIIFISSPEKCLFRSSMKLELNSLFAIVCMLWRVCSFTCSCHMFSPIGEIWGLSREVSSYKSYNFFFFYFFGVL